MILLAEENFVSSGSSRIFDLLNVSGFLLQQINRPALAGGFAISAGVCADKQSAGLCLAGSGIPCPGSRLS